MCVICITYLWTLNSNIRSWLQFRQLIINSFKNYKLHSFLSFFSRKIPSKYNIPDRPIVHAGNRFNILTNTNRRRRWKEAAHDQKFCIRRRSWHKVIKGHEYNCLYAYASAGLSRYVSILRSSVVLWLKRSPRGEPKRLLKMKYFSKKRREKYRSLRKRET